MVLSRPFLPWPQLRHWLRVELVEGATSVMVSIDNPIPWPPNGIRQYDADAVLAFRGGWCEANQEGERFAADSILPPVETGRPLVQAGGFGQPRLWLGALAGAVALVFALQA